MKFTSNDAASMSTYLAYDFVSYVCRITGTAFAPVHVVRTANQWLDHRPDLYVAWKAMRRLKGMHVP